MKRITGKRLTALVLALFTTMSVIQMPVYAAETEIQPENQMESIVMEPESPTVTDSIEEESVMAPSTETLTEETQEETKEETTAAEEETTEAVIEEETTAEASSETTENSEVIEPVQETAAEETTAAEAEVQEETDDVEASVMEEESETETEEETEAEPVKDTVKKENANLEAPQISSVEAKAKGVIIKWNQVSGAKGYMIYRRSDQESNWKKLQTVTAANYKDTTCVSGESYYYTVRAYNDKDTSGYYDPGYYFVYLSTPVLKDTAAKSSGIKVSWQAVNGASSYRIYRKLESDSDWTMLTEVTGTNYTDTSVVSGTGYLYTVRAFTIDNGQTFRSYFNTTGVGGCLIEEPHVKKVSNVVDGLKVKWGAVAGVDGYCVYRMQRGYDKWKLVGTVSGANTVTFTDENIKDGKYYTYCIKAFKTVGKSKAFSTHDDGKGVRRLVRPSGLKATKASSGFTITWKAVDKADSYIVYRRISGSQKWVEVGKTTSLSYTDKSASHETDYNYCVCALNDTGKSNFNIVNSPSAVQERMIKKAQYYNSSTNYLIMVNTTSNWFGVFRRSGGKWELYKYWRTTTGSKKSPTCLGVYRINYKGYSFGTADYTCYYYSSFNGPYLIHSTKFYPGTFKDKDPSLGRNKSGGCVRLHIDNAKWVYDNIPIGTAVVTYTE